VGSPKLHLASASPRRREILSALGLIFSWAPTDVDETPLPGEPADGMVLRLASGKAHAAGKPAHIVTLAADTEVVLGSHIFGKAESSAEAVDMLCRLSGQTHRVVTGVVLLVQGVESAALSSSEVRFRKIAPGEADAYCRSGEYRGKAGAYAIQGLGGVFVESLYGSYTGVVGLPVFETAGLLRAAGLDILRMTNIAGPAL
jgi:septum formation protein